MSDFLDAVMADHMAAHVQPEALRAAHEQLDLAERAILKLQTVNADLIDELANALTHGDGAAVARCISGAAIVLALLEQLPSHEFAKDERQQAVWRAKAWLEEGT